MTRSLSALWALPLMATLAAAPAFAQDTADTAPILHAGDVAATDASGAPSA